jgi:hypothetical protein
LSDGVVGSRQHEVSANLPHMLTAAEEIARRADADRKGEGSGVAFDFGFWILWLVAVKNVGCFYLLLY